MKKAFGFALCQEQVLERAAARVDFICRAFEQDDRMGDSPIEKLFYMALHYHLLLCEQEYFMGLMAASPDGLDAAKSSPRSKRHIIVQRQMQLDGWRVDFLLTVYADWAREPEGGTECWMQLIVECDGHDYHERTKEQAARDRDRDRRFQLSGIDVFRFTGSELWKDPMGCADQVIAWANRRV